MADKLENGWTEQELAEYLRERQQAQERLIDPHSEFRQEARRSDVQNCRYNVHRWRR